MGLRRDASWILVEQMRGTWIDVKLYSDARARQSQGEFDVFFQKQIQRPYRDETGWQAAKVSLHGR